MCGLAGYVVRRLSADRTQALALLEAVRVRGPDDEGLCLISRHAGTVTHLRTPRTVSAAGAGLQPADAPSPVTHDVALLHTRFAIIDLSPMAHQPMASADGSIVAVCNGEFYNYLELRSELQASGVTFRTKSDTEVLVEGYRLWRDGVWARLNGFWAVALYDRREGAVILSRDRLGVAPLYYRETEHGLFFGSNIRSLTRISPQALPDPEYGAAYVETGLKDFDRSTCFAGVYSLPPGTVARIASRDASLTDSATRPFWSPPDRRLRTTDLSFDEAVNRLRDTLFDAVALRLRADVQLAFELSGGLDSSSLVAAAHAIGHRDIRTYTIRVPRQDEEPYARAMSKLFPVDFRVIDRPEETFFEELDEFTDLMEEPYHSPNIYTHYRMRRRMKADGVHVALSGSGGDEVLAGYEHDFWPAAARDMSSAGQRLEARLFAFASRFGTWDRIVHSLGTRARWLLKGVGRHWYRPLAFYRERFGAPPPLVAPAAANLDGNAATRLLRQYPELSFTEQVLFHLRVAQLPYYLRSNDHFTMSIPLEHRFPFLDYRLVELGLQLPPSYLFRNGWTKYVLRKAMEPFLPREVAWRREKMGFPFPLHRFLATQRSRLSSFCGKDMDRYDALLRDDPQRLWRACSLGIWKSRLDGTSGRPTTERASI